MQSNMVEVFKTNISDKTTAGGVLADLNTHFPESHINFDLDDCDNILRVEAKNINPKRVAEILTGKGFFCEVLE